MPSQSDFETGRSQLNRQLVAGAANIAGPAAQLAAGASKMEVASGILKDAALDKLLGPTAVFAGSLVGVLRTVRAIVRESGLLEKGLQRIASVQSLAGKFETLLRSATAAKARIEELYRFTARSPFDFSDVAEANRILEALTRGAYSGEKAMQAVGDMAAATGSSMASAADKVAKLHAALASGRSFDKIAFQLQYSGVVTDALAAKLEALEAQGASFSSKWQEVEKVLAQTGGGMRNELETLDALKTRLDNANAAMAQAFGEPYVEAQVAAMKAMIAATGNLTPLVGEIGRDFSVFPNLVRDAKNSLLDNVAACRGFADALRIAYKVGFSLFAGLAGSVVVMAARNIAALGSATLTTATAMRAGYAAALAATKAQAGLTLATALSTSANQAFAAGNLLSAAALKAESVWLWAKTRALAANAAASSLAGAGTAAYSVGAHAANLATAGLAGTVKLAGKGLGMLGGMMRGAAVAFLSNPWAAGAAALLTVAAGLYKWSEAAKVAAQDARELAASISDTTKRLAEQSAAVRSLTDWQNAVEKLRSRYADLTAQIVAFHRKAVSGADVTREETAANAKNVAEWRQTRAALDKETRRNTRNLDLSEGEKETVRQDQAARRAAQDQKSRLAVSSAQTPEQKLAAMDARRAELIGRIRAGHAAKAGETTALRDGSAAQRVTTEQKLADITAKFDQRIALVEDKRDADMEEAGAKRNGQGEWERVTSPALAIWGKAEPELSALRTRRAAAVSLVERSLREMGLNSPSPTVRAQAQLDEAVRLGKGPAEVERLTRALEEAKAAVAGLADAEAELADLTAQVTQEARDLGRQLAAQNMVNEFDTRIAAAKKAGRPVAGLEFDKAMALAEVKRSDAQTPEERQAAQNEINGLLAEREAGRREVARERARNAAFARGGRKGAMAFEDAGALRERVNQYAGLGLSARDAERDFRANLVAEAANRPPSIIADSLQSIGGGGGAYGGGNPVLQAQERATKAAEQAARETAAARALLADIRDRMGDE